MPWKLIFTVLIVIIATVFIGFNLGNACDVSFGVYVLKDVPVFMSIMVAFAVGVLLMVPFTFGKKHGRERPAKTGTAQKKEPAAAGTPDSGTGAKNKKPIIISYDDDPAPVVPADESDSPRYRT